MKKYIVHLIITAQCACLGYAEDLKTNEWGAVTNYFQMSIRLESDQNQIKTNQPCELLICYKNSSTNETFHVYERNGTEHDPEYSFSIVSPSGKDISPDMKHIRHGDSGGERYAAPNQTITIKFDLSKLCTFNEVGTYKIVAKKSGIWSFQNPRSFTVVSNPLTVLVVP